MLKLELTPKDLPKTERPSQETFTLILTKEELAWLFHISKDEFGEKDPITIKLKKELFHEA